MFKAIYLYELRGLLKQKATYVYFTVLFSIALITMLGTGGYFDGVKENGNEIHLLNSAHAIHSILQYFSKFLLFLLPAIIGMVVYKDFNHNVHPILFSFPIKKSAYLSGKFLSALTVVFLISISIGIALLVGEWMLGANNRNIGPTNLQGYLAAYCIFMLPNMLLYGLLVFSAVASSRNIYTGFLVVLLLFLFQIIFENLFAGNELLFALFDPFGENAAAYETRFWTIAEQNMRQIPVNGIVLWNRIFWAIISICFFGYFYKKFQLEQETFIMFSRVTNKRITNFKSVSDPQKTTYQQLNLHIDFSGWQQVKTMLILSAIDFRFILKNWLFHVLLLFGVLAIVFAMYRVTNTGDMSFLPLTRIMLNVPMLFFSIVIMLLTFIYAGLLIHRPQMAMADQLIDATATSKWVLLGSKMLALMQIQLLQLLIMLLCGIGLQLYNGYYQIEIGLYVFHLSIISFPALIIWAAVSVCIHTIFPNAYLGIFMLILIWLGKDQLPTLGIESFLFRFNSTPTLIYSDLNGYGSNMLAHHLVNAYWLMFAGLLLVFTYLYWVRGITFSIKERIAKAISRWKGIVPYTSFVLVACFCFLGLTIYQEEKKSSIHAGNMEQLLTDFNMNFSKYKTTNQPKISSIKLNLAIYPDTNSFVANGHYVLTNKSLKKIDTLLIKTGYDEITDYSFDIPARILNKDTAMKFTVYVLDNSLLSGDSMQMHFQIRNKPNTLFYQGSAVHNNGTFLRADILPRIGYFFDTHSLVPTDSLAKFSNFYAADADLVNIETIISTNHLQTAIAPGTLQNHWTENNRKYFHYKTAEKIKFAFAFNSGDFKINKTQYKGTSIEIYHHQNHSFNIKHMIDGLKAALDYNNFYFGPYQHKEVKVIEYPLTEGSHATVMGNAIPTSENWFILNSSKEGSKINLPFYIQAHELTHQWWGNQVVPANAWGAKMLTESITEYISLRIYAKHFGEVKALKFLALQRQRYLQGRTNETKQENPLYLVQPEQEYIAYGKGAIALNTLQYYVGEDKLNSILRSFLEAYKFKTNYYPTTIDLIAHLKKSISPSFHYVITDMMETITFYDHQIVGIKQLPNSKSEMTISVTKLDKSMKYELNANNILLSIGQYNIEGNLIHINQFNVSSGKHKLIIAHDPNLKTIALDPLLHFIEFDLANNKMDL